MRKKFDPNSLSSRKQPPLVRDHIGLTFWVDYYRRFKYTCTMYMYIHLLIEIHLHVMGRAFSTNTRKNNFTSTINSVQKQKIDT